MDAQKLSLEQVKKYWVEFISDRTFLIHEDQTILDASLKAGIPHYHECGGKGKCSTCRVLVHNGMEHLSPPSEKEILLRKKMFFPSNVRLACQTFVKGDHVLLHRIIRDEDDMRLYIDQHHKNIAEHHGHEKEMALFFLDIRNFTPFMESLLPFDVIHIMRRLFGLFRKVIENYDGRIIETGGDGFYAVFGFDSEIRLSVNNAFSAARDILRDLEEFNDQYAEKYFFHYFRIGIGLHAGRVIVGNIGIGVNNNLTVMGLPVNVASRIQTSTKALNNDLITSGYFYDILHPKPPAKQVQTNLKGIRGEQTLYLCGNPYK